MADDYHMQTVRCPFDQVLFQSESLMIGEFNCAVDDPCFSDTGPIENHILVVPFQPVEIRFSRGRSIVADPTRVLLYNRGTNYRREALNRIGDRSLWLAFDNEALEDLHGVRPEEPFSKQVERLTLGLYLSVRRLYRGLLSGTMDRMRAEETGLELLATLAPASGNKVHPATRRQYRAIAAADEYLARHYTEAVQLADVARAADLSPYHLSRLFPRLRGTGIHQHLMQLRLRDAVDRLQDGRESITDIAMGLGFSSPSHFSSCFRKALGTSPNRFRHDSPESRAII